MSNRASVFLKQVLTVLSTVVKAKSLAIKSKTRAMKTRLLIFSLLKNKKVLAAGSISHKIHALIGHLDHNKKHQNEADQSKDMVLYNAMANYESQFPNQSCTDLAEQDYYNYYGDEHDDQTRSVIDMVKTAKEEDGEKFRLEDDIDHVADLFIRRFHCQIKMQKQESFKRYQEMLERSV